MRQGCLAAIAAAPVVLALGAMLPVHAAATARPVSATSQLPPCPVSHPAPHGSQAATSGTAQIVSVTVPALPGVNCR